MSHLHDKPIESNHESSRIHEVHSTSSASTAARLQDDVYQSRREGNSKIGGHSDTNRKDRLQSSFHVTSGKDIVGHKGTAGTDNPAGTDNQAGARRNAAGAEQTAIQNSHLPSLRISDTANAASQESTPEAGKPVAAEAPNPAIPEAPKLVDPAQNAATIDGDGAKAARTETTDSKANKTAENGRDRLAQDRTEAASFAANLEHSKPEQKHGHHGHGHYGRGHHGRGHHGQSQQDSSSSALPSDDPDQPPNTSDDGSLPSTEAGSINRSQFNGQLKNPGVMAAFAGRIASEVGSQGPAAQLAFAEAVMNRAAARNQSLMRALSGSYYPTYNPGSSHNPQYILAITKAWQEGTDTTNGATGNSSGTVGFGARGGHYNANHQWVSPNQTARIGGERFGYEQVDLNNGWLNKYRQFRGLA